MYDAMFKNSGVDFQNLFAPAQRLNTLLVDQVAKVTAFQLDAVKSYSDMGLEQMRAVAGIQDAKSLEQFIQNQNRVVKTLGEKLNQDASTFAGFGKDFTAELQKLAQESVVGIGKGAKAA